MFADHGFDKLLTIKYQMSGFINHSSFNMSQWQCVEKNKTQKCVATYLMLALYSLNGLNGIDSIHYCECLLLFAIKSVTVHLGW